MFDVDTGIRRCWANLVEDEVEEEEEDVCVTVMLLSGDSTHAVLELATLFPI